jgi:hypothetical protein
MTSGLVVTSDKHDAALQRLLSTSKRGAVTVCKQEFGIILTNVARLTPPAILNQNVTGKKAEVIGKAAVARDISSLYGTPNDAYSLITDKGGAAQASAFWLMHSQGQDDVASQIMKQATGKSFSDFDGGELHGRTAGGKRRRSSRKREPVFYVRNPDDLQKYIEEEQSHVWWLASGWAPALRALGRKLPYGVDRGNAPGTLKVQVTTAKIEITAIDQVGFASNVTNIEDRIKRAMDFRADRLQNTWDNYIKTLSGETGMKVKS